jgi:D-alanine-D-alanine ligase
MYQPRNQPPLIWLFCGGPSSEYKVSISSALNIALSLDRAAYQVLPVCIHPSGSWWLARKPLGRHSTSIELRSLFEAFELDQPDPFIEVVSPAAIGAKGEGRIHQHPPDCALVMIHGELGEDGVLQGLLEVLDIPYTGSGVLACALSMDKILCQKILAQHAIAVPPHATLKLEAGQSAADAHSLAIGEQVGYPCFVKPSNGGSSIGISLVQTAAELPAAIELAARYDNGILIERKIDGVEVTCGVMDLVEDHGGVNTVAFPPTEIAPLHAAYFDYEAKYTPGKTDEITPARFPENVLDEIRATALRVHSIIGCEGYSRVDMIVSGEQIYVFETNTVPGMTPTSLFPQGARAHGLSPAQMIDQLIRFAWWKR